MKSALLVAAVAVLAGGAAAQTVDAMWATNCQMCHGPQGKGGILNCPTLLTDDKFDEKLDKPFFDAISTGHPGTNMKGFEAKLSAEQRWALVNYIRELQLKNIRASTSTVAAPKAVDGVHTTHLHAYRVEDVVASGVATPWAIAFLPGGDSLITERAGKLGLLHNGTLGEPITGTPDVFAHGQGGLMAVAIHPDYATNGWIYLSFSDPRGGSDGKTVAITKIIRGHITDGAWKDQEVIFAAQPEHYLSGDIHFGSRIVFGAKAPNGKRYTFFCIGERGRGELAQDLSRPNGKVYRVYDDGTVPDDNPFVDKADAYKAIWSYGHRNPQGLVMDHNGELFDTEHAPRGGDELNRITRGANYGWPVISFGINYNGTAFRLPWPAEGQNFTMPVTRFMPSIAACGLAECRGGAFPKWDGDLFAGGLAGNCVHRVRIRDGKLVEREEILFGMGRVRDVVCGPKGELYIALNEPDKIVRLVPADKK
jgi:glucose/arabinose dehydrogenase